MRLAFSDVLWDYFESIDLVGGDGDSNWLVETLYNNLGKLPASEQYWVSPDKIHSGLIDAIISLFTKEYPANH